MTYLADDVASAIALVAENRVDAVVVDCQPGSTALSDLSTQIHTQQLPEGPLLVALVAGGVPFIDVLKSRPSESFIRPLKPERLLSYLRSELGKGITHATASNSHLVPGLRIDIEAHQAFAGDVPVPLSPIEFRILSVLMTVPGRVFGRPELIGAVWSTRNFVDPRTVDVHVARLRRTLAKAIGHNLIRTVRGEGYSVILT
jgi:two-component system, OmpR family, phosphate regulon response regulator PhoB